MKCSLQSSGLLFSFATPMEAGRALDGAMKTYHVYDAEAPFQAVEQPRVLTQMDSSSPGATPCCSAGALSVIAPMSGGLRSYPIGTEKVCEDMCHLEEELAAFLKLPSLPSRQHKPVRPGGSNGAHRDKNFPKQTQNASQLHEIQLEAARAHIRSLTFQITQLRADETQVVSMLKAKCCALERDLLSKAADDVNVCHAGEKGTSTEAPCEQRDADSEPMGDQGCGDEGMEAHDELGQVSRQLRNMRQQMTKLSQSIADVKAELASRAAGRAAGSPSFEGNDIRARLHELCADVAEIKRLIGRQATPRLAKDLVSGEGGGCSCWNEGVGDGSDAQKNAVGLARDLEREREREDLNDESVFTWEVPRVKCVGLVLYSMNVSSPPHRCSRSLATTRAGVCAVAPPRPQASPGLPPHAASRYSRLAFEHRDFSAALASWRRRRVPLRRGLCKESWSRRARGARMALDPACGSHHSAHPSSLEQVCVWACIYIDRLDT